MLTLAEFPHHNARYTNDHRQATLVFYLLAAFVVALFLLGVVIR